MTVNLAVKPRPLPQVQFMPDGRRIFELAGGTQLEKFFMDRAHVSGIRGPIGSAKTATAFQKVWQIACEQAPSPSDGLRKTRWGFIRNTYGELEGTTVKDFLEQFPPEQYGEMYYSRPLEFHMSLADVRCEIVFMALDRADDIKKIRSTQFTGFFLHEMQYLPKEIFDECESRTGRYPGPADGFATWDGVIFDMNEPGEDHWLLPMTGEVPYPEGLLPSEQIRWPKDWRYYVQPPALIEVFNPDGKTIHGYRINPKAENLKWLKPDYYPNKIKGKEKAWIDSRLMNRISVWVDGKPVWPQFNTETHVANTALKATPGYPILMGMDFGRSPAVVFGQLIGNRWYLLDELCAYDIDTTDFAPMVKRKLDSKFPGYEFRIWGDPKGADKTQNSTRTSYDIMASFGFRVDAAPCGDNDLVIRLGAVNSVLKGMQDGAPRLILCPEHCRTLKVAMAGKYHFRRQKMAGGYEEKPYKDRYSNIADALQYLMVGEGEGNTMVGRPAGSRGKVVRLHRAGGHRFSGARKPFS
jgi:hypothetical protein